MRLVIRGSEGSRWWEEESHAGLWWESDLCHYADVQSGGEVVHGTSSLHVCRPSVTEGVHGSCHKLRIT